MANKTIPQLPEQTGKTDNDLLAIVDSGETTTSKIKVSTLLSGVGGGKYIAADGTNNIVPDYYATTSINASVSNSGIVAGSSNTINSGNNQAIVGGTNNQLSSVGRSVMIGGNTNTIGSRNENAIIGGTNNTNYSRYSTILGGQNNNAANGSQRGSIVGGQYNTLSEGLNSVVVGGNNGRISLTWNSVNIAPYNNAIYHDQSHQQWEGFSLYSAPECNIRQTSGSGTGAIKGGNCSIFNSYQCDIAGQTGNETNFGTIIGSNKSDITGGTTNTIMLGTSGRTGLNSYTTYVETLEAFTHVVLNDYSNLNFADDSAAATGGVPLGGVYHTSGALKIRIT